MCLTTIYICEKDGHQWDKKDYCEYPNEPNHYIKEEMPTGHSMHRNEAQGGLDGEVWLDKVICTRCFDREKARVVEPQLRDDHHRFLSRCDNTRATAKTQRVVRRDYWKSRKGGPFSKPTRSGQAGLPRPQATQAASAYGRERTPPSTYLAPPRRRSESPRGIGIDPPARNSPPPFGGIPSALGISAPSVNPFAQRPLAPGRGAHPPAFAQYPPQTSDTIEVASSGGRGRGKAPAPRPADLATFAPGRKILPPSALNPNIAADGFEAPKQKFPDAPPLTPDFVKKNRNSLFKKPAQAHPHADMLLRAGWIEPRIHAYWRGNDRAHRGGDNSHSIAKRYQMARDERADWGHLLPYEERAVAIDRLTKLGYDKQWVIKQWQWREDYDQVLAQSGSARNNREDKVRKRREARHREKARKAGETLADDDDDEDDDVDDADMNRSTAGDEFEAVGNPNARGHALVTAEAISISSS